MHVIHNKNQMAKNAESRLISDKEDNLITDKLNHERCWTETNAFLLVIT